MARCDSANCNSQETNDVYCGLCNEELCLCKSCQRNRRGKCQCGESFRGERIANAHSRYYETKAASPQLLSQILGE